MLRRTALRARQFVHDRLADHRPMEAVYQRLFETSVAELGIRRKFYPVGAAANYSLLYLIVRCVAECEIRTVAEFGAGQSTLLLAALGRLRPELRVVSYEADPAWADRIRGEADCDIRVCPLMEYGGAGNGTLFYQLPPERERSDLVIVDGPVGASSAGRTGCLAVVPDLVGPDSVVIVDDVNRAPEMLMSDQLVRALMRRNYDLASSFVRAAKWQRVIASGSRRHAVYF